MVQVSIIVPVYKVENTIVKCVNSILNQTFTDFELILVDDGSPDSSGTICDEYAEKDNRIKVIHKKNGGVSSARNAGIDIAKGKFICFVDSDDYVEINYLNEMMKAKKMYPEICNIWCGFNIIKDDNETEHKMNIFNDSADNRQKYFFSDISEFMTLHEKWLDPMPWNKLFDSEIIKKNNLKMDESLTLGEDFLFNMSYLDVAENSKILIINKPLINYVADNNVSLDSKYYEDIFDMYNTLNNGVKKYLDKWDLSDKENAKFYSMVFFSFEKVFRNTMRKENNISFTKKIRYNNCLIKSREFIECVNKMDYQINKIIKALYKKNYLYVFLLEKYLNRK